MVANVGANQATYTTTGLNNNDAVSVVLTSSETCASGSPATSNAITTTVNAVLPVSVTIASSDADDIICAGTSVTFTATPTNGGSTPSYQWKLNGANVGANQATYTTTGLNNNDAVSVVLTSSETCASGSPAASNTITTTVNAVLPVSVTIASSDADDIICAGTSVTFTATPTNGGATPSYQWKLNGANVGANQATYTTTGLTNNDAVSVVLTSSETCASGSPATSNTITTTVNAVLPVSVTIASSDADDIICAGTSVTFTATPTNGGSTPSYQWKLNGANVGANQATYTTTGLNNNDAVSVVLTSSETCASGSPAASNTITTTVNAVLPVSVTIASSDADDIICAGTSVTFTATPTNGGATPSYQWKLNGNNVGSRPGYVYNINPCPVDDQVSVVLTSSETCASGSPATSNTITTTVNAVLPVSVTIASSDADDIICAGTSVTFTATPTNGGSTPSYQWKLNGANVGANQATYTTSTLASGDQVSVVLTSSETCASGSPAASNTIATTVNAVLPVSVTIASSDADDIICAGTSVTFTATPTNGGATPSYQWKLNGANVGANQATYTTSTLASGDQVSVVLTSSETCASGTPAASNRITTTVNAVLPVSVTIASSDADDIICAGTSVTFTATPTNGGATPSYQWKLNGANVGTNQATYTTTGLVNNDVITVVLTSSETCASGSPAASNSIATTVNAVLPVSVAIASSDADDIICAGTSVTFTATPTNGGATPSYQWKLNGANVGANQATYTTTGLANNDVITVVLTSSETCASGSPAASNTITTTVNAVLPVSVTIASSDADDIICAGTSVTFTATPTNGGATPSYQWKLNGANVGANQATYTTSTLASGDQVSVVLTSSETCASGSPAASNSIATTVNAVLPVSVTIASSDADDIICAGTSVTFTATPTNGGSTPSYQWKLNGANVGANQATYTTSTLASGDQVSVVLTSSETCASGSPAASNTITTTVNAVLPVSVTIASSDADDIICAGTSVTFTATPTNGGATPSYQWKLNGANVGTNQATYTTSTLASGDAVSVVLTSSETCASGSPAASNSIATTVNAVLPVSVAIASSDADDIICAGTSVTFTATPTNGGATPSYQWKLNGANVGANQATYTTSTLASGDQVSVVLTSSETCASGTPATSSVITTTVNAVLEVTVAIVSDDVDNTICAGTSVTFTATSTNSGTTPHYQWKLNGNDVGTDQATYTTTTLASGDVLTVVLTSNATPCATGSPATSMGLA